MGLLTDYFVADSDPDAARVLKLVQGPAASPFPTVELKSVDPVVNMATLEEILTGEGADQIIDAEKPVVAEAGKDGPGVYRIRSSLTKALANLAEGRRAEVARAWSQTDEFAGAEVSELIEVLDKLIPLAARAVREGKGLYCWMSQ